MGYSVPNGYSKEKLVGKLIADIDEAKRKVRTLDHHLEDDILWTVREFTDKESGEIATAICCDILEKFPNGWGYKDIDECMGPAYYTCPMRMLQRVPTVNEGWRKKVAQFHNMRLGQDRANHDLFEDVPL